MDGSTEFGYKKLADRLRNQHRWSNEETITMLKSVAKMKKDSNRQFERPTAEKFYEELKCKYFRDCTLNHIVMKSKMRQLRLSYLKAIEWKDNVGMQLYDSDQRHVLGRIKSICPYYNLLDEIFGSTSNVDPIGICLPEKQIGGETIYSDFADSPAKKVRKESLESLIMPKVESFIDEQDTFVDEYEESQDETFQSNSTFANYEQTKNFSKTTRSNAKTTETDSLEERTLQFEIRKFEEDRKLQAQRISLEEKRLNFEKEKFEKVQRLRKYEIDKQFEIKLREIESNERIKLLEVNKTTDPVVIGVEDMPSYE